MQQVVLFGSSPFSCVVLQLLFNHQIDIVSVVTNPDKPAGRHLKLTPNPVKSLALGNHIKVYESLIDLEVSEGSVGLVAAYGKIIPPAVLDKFKDRIYNIHPSLLPKYRGPSPLQQQILDEAGETGVTIIQLDAQMDHGPIVTQEKDRLDPNDTTQSLGERLFAKGTRLFISEVLNKSSQLKPQDHSQATYTKLLTRQDGFIPWAEFDQLIKSYSTQPDHSHANRLDRLFRAYHPWPGIWTLNPQNQRLKVLSLAPLRVV